MPERNGNVFEAWREGRFVHLRVEYPANGRWTEHDTSLQVLDTSSCSLESVDARYYHEEPPTYLSFEDGCPSRDDEDEEGEPVAAPAPERIPTRSRRLELARALVLPLELEPYDSDSPRFAASILKALVRAVPCPNVDCDYDPDDLGMIAFDASGRRVTRAFVPTQRAFPGVPVANPAAYVDGEQWPAIRAAWGLPATPPDACSEEASAFGPVILGPTSAPTRAFETPTHAVFTSPVHTRPRGHLVAIHDRASNTHRYVGRLDGEPTFSVVIDGLLFGWVSTFDDMDGLNDGIFVIDLAHASLHLIHAHGPAGLPRVEGDEDATIRCQRRISLTRDGDSLVVSSPCGNSRIELAPLRTVLTQVLP